ncbi:MAG TPA: hypothetical protein VHR47_04475 [Bacillota bacterium]|nr:hypothetical protein [Bacillota bacterium]
MGTPFNGDFHIEKAIKKLCRRFRVATIIETGTFRGDTTPVLAKYASVVHTVEVNTDFFATLNFAEPNIIKHRGSSPDVLRAILGKVKKPCLFYLDAHWDNYWPLMDELKAIAYRAKNSVLVIHDFLNPEQPGYGYDTYNGQALCFEYISGVLSSIYPSGYSFHYNSKADGLRRGVIYIYPKTLIIDKNTGFAAVDR